MRARHTNHLTHTHTHRVHNNPPQPLPPNTQRAVNPISVKPTETQASLESSVPTRDNELSFLQVNCRFFARMRGARARPPEGVGTYSRAWEVFYGSHLAPHGFGSLAQLFCGFREVAF